MEPARALVVESELDLRLFSAYLWQQGVAHRVFEESGVQVLEVADHGHVGRVREEFDAWRGGALRLRALPRGDDGHAGRVAGFTSLLRHARGFPVLVSVVVLAIVCFPVTWTLQQGQLNPALSALTIIELRDVSPALLDSRALLVSMLRDGEIWRLVTPVLLHFGAAHLVFNLVAVTIFGRTIEKAAGSVPLLLMTLAIAAVSNTAQFLSSGNPLFGGLSGVAYGLFGFVAVRSRQAPRDPDWALNPALTVTILLLLVLMSTGITELFGLYIAHAAHWTGLLTGAVLALLWPLRGGAGRRSGPSAS
jgi:GlpG protein